jgi:DNA repair exonuclease SbcCD ATPase subunit
MRIIGFQAENFKRLRAVEITPTGDVVVLSGRNAQGKTSILDGVEAALTGVDTKRLPQPIRDGEVYARVVLDLDEYTVTRTWEDGKPSKLVVETKDGVKVAKAQTALNALTGSLSFDPLEFARMAPKEQVDSLLSLVDLPFDPAQLEATRRGTFEKRTDVNRKVRELAALIAAQPKVPDLTPDTEVSLADLLDESRKADAYWDSFQRSRQYVDKCADDDRDAARRVEDLQAQLQAAQAEALAASEELEQAQGHHSGYDLDRMPDRDHLRARMGNVEETNRAVRTKQATAKLVDDHARIKASAEKLTEDLEALEETKRAGLAATTMPIEGLSFDEDGVLYQDIPFKQASSAEQLRVSLAMAMALNPQLRIIRISDGSLLDSDSLRVVGELAAAHDYQVWIEMVDESGSLGFVIEDGQVVPSVAAAA